MVLVVPEEDLFEQGIWPSVFSDHRSTFRLDRETTWSPVSHEIRGLVSSLPGAEVISAEIQDEGYDHALKRLGAETDESRRLRLRHRQFLLEIGPKRLLSIPLLDELNRLFHDLGATVDQTAGSALAQIQIIARKVSN